MIEKSYIKRNDAKINTKQLELNIIQYFNKTYVNKNYINCKIFKKKWWYNWNILYFFFKDMSLLEYVNKTNNIYKNLLFLKKEKFIRISNKIINKIDINTSSINSS